ncbi:MAG TPA: hypothetical protein DHS57_03650 [Erysipelotrichaceae bacterium]|nr:hypothetical protein [Erysipelotrichaceae bacterium]
MYEVIQESFKKLNCENKERENNYERGTLKIKKVYDKKRNKMLILDNISSIKLIFDRLNKISAIEYTEESQYANGVWYSTTFNTCDFKIEFDLGSEN